MVNKKTALIDYSLLTIHYLSLMKRFMVFLFMVYGCAAPNKVSWPEKPEIRITGTEFYRMAAGMNWEQRDSFAVQQLLAGNMPSFMKKFETIKVDIIDGETGTRTQAEYYVTPDYLSIGTDDDWARIPLTPMAAQIVADSLGCFLPTKKMVDDIYIAAKVKLDPVPMYAFRDSTPTMWHHHLIIEGQRKGQKGLIAGIKKDVVISGKISRDTRPNRVAIYGWHKPDGKSIQPLYTGHVNWYVDYSHGIRLVSQKIKVYNKWFNYRDVLRDRILSQILCDEEHCDFARY
jgi:hypothetical protein